MKCNEDCWNCKYEGCINISTEDLVRQNTFDKEENSDRKPRVNEADRRYNKSEKAKACKKRYLQTENGKNRNRINAKKGYERNKEYYLYYKKLWYQENKDRINKKRRETYRENKPVVSRAEKKRKALWVWKKRYIAKHGEEPTWYEIQDWEIRYEKKGVFK